MQFNDDAESSQDREIDILTRQVTGLFREAERQLKRIAGRDSHTSDASVRVNIQRSLAVQLQALAAPCIRGTRLLTRRRNAK